MSVFKVGDKVWSNVMGDGVVCMISADGSYPVCVKFNECTEIQRYTTEGKWREYDKEPEIFLKVYNGYTVEDAPAKTIKGSE